MKELTEERISERITVLGFLMTCFIVLYHTGMPVEGISPLDDKLNQMFGGLFDTLAVIAMSHFFAITGYLLFKDLNWKSWRKKICRRFVSLMIPYFIWQVVFYFYVVVVGGRKFSFLDVVRLFLPASYISDGALWYLYAVFILALLSPIVLLVYKKKWLGLLFIVLATVVTYLIKDSGNTVIHSIYMHCWNGQVFVYLPSFLIGTFYGYYFKTPTYHDLTYCLGFALAGIICNGVVGLSNDIVIKVLPIIGLYYFPVVGWMRNKKMAYLYNISFFIYAIHQPLLSPFIQYIRGVIRRIIPYSTVSNVFGRVGFLAFIIILSMILYSVFSKWGKPILKVLTGGRSKPKTL